MVIVAPGLDPTWFFETAQPYWNQFRPIVTTDISLVDLIDHQKSLAVTVISPPDAVIAMTQRIQQQYPNVWFDLIVAEDKQGVANIFNDRVHLNQRFG
jgi:hypothetical protein